MYKHNEITIGGASKPIPIHDVYLKEVSSQKLIPVKLIWNEIHLPDGNVVSNGVEKDYGWEKDEENSKFAFFDEAGNSIDFKSLLFADRPNFLPVQVPPRHAMPSLKCKIVLTDGNVYYGTHSLWNPQYINLAEGMGAMKHVFRLSTLTGDIQTIQYISDHADYAFPAASNQIVIETIVNDVFSLEEGMKIIQPLSVDYYDNACWKVSY